MDLVVQFSRDAASQLRRYFWPSGRDVKNFGDPPVQVAKRAVEILRCWNHPDSCVPHSLFGRGSSLLSKLYIQYTNRFHQNQDDTVYDGDSASWLPLRDDSGFRECLSQLSEIRRREKQY